MSSKHTADDFQDDPAPGRRVVPFHYVLTGQTHHGQLGTVVGVVEMAPSKATRSAGFVYAMRLLADQMDSGVAVVLHFSFERDTL
ncbi:hypothetical protein ABTY53_23015 [Streptomyces noursei]|uniref:hypothetical protein n=1 Tax=Streptomyces noursei TaxID=1971 RepID=UPI00331B0CE3